MKPPIAKRKPTRIQRHGDVRVDPYAWLHRRDDPEVLAYLEAENRYTAQRMRSTKDLRAKLFEEMRRRIKETDLDVPVRIDDYFYFSRTEKGRQYPILCRKHRSLRARTHVLLDQNRLAKGKPYFAVGVQSISPDHALLAYTTDTSGDERYTLQILDVASGKLLPEVIPDVAGVAWARDGRTLFYSVIDHLHRPHAVFRHWIGTSLDEDERVFYEPDEAFYLSIGTTRSRDFVLLELHAKTTSEIHFLPASEPRQPFRLVQKRRRHVEYAVDHHGDSFYVLHNHKAKNFALARTPIARPGARHWVPVVPHREEVLLEDVSVFENHLVLYEREGGLPHVRIRNLSSGAEHRVRFPESVYTVDEDANPEFHTNTLRLRYSSLVTPASVFDYDMNKRTRQLLKQAPVLGGYAAQEYVTERLFAAAPDGARVPISLVYRRGIERDGSNPLFLTGYGAYGMSRDPSFSSVRLSLLDRGVVYAIAHVRGGSEMGREWYEDGKFLKKKNTFTDFIACAEALIALGYTTPARLAINGGSAGGLLMGAVANLRPDLFGVVVADVPFVDVLSTMLDPSLPLTVIEYDEWGNPGERKYYDYIKSYSPYDNIRPQAYPTMLVTAGINDPRVSYWEPAKFVAKLRAMKTDDNELLLKTQMSAGHFGASGRYEALKEVAFDFAFILTRLGVEPARTVARARRARLSAPRRRRERG